MVKRKTSLNAWCESLKVKKRKSIRTKTLSLVANALTFSFQVEASNWDRRVAIRIMFLKEYKGADFWSCKLQAFYQQILTSKFSQTLKLFFLSWDFMLFLWGQKHLNLWYLEGQSSYLFIYLFWVIKLLARK